MKTILLSIVVAFGLNVQLLLANENPVATPYTIDEEDLRKILVEDEPAINLDFTDKIETLYVYDLQGNLLMTKTNHETGVSLAEIPYGAMLLMKDERAYYYILDK